MVENLYQQAVVSRFIEHTERLSNLSFENRGEADRKEALRPVRGNGGGTSAQAAFARDVHLIEDSPAFRRLFRQTMIAPSDSHAFQNRGSHSMAVADVGIRIAEALHLGAASKELIRAIAYAHDIGHPPFSHQGEEATNRRLKEFGIQWDHDSAVLDVLLKNSLHGLAYDGPPLTHAAVEGIAKRYHHTDTGYNHVEGQVAATADWIAATVTDIQDIMTMKAESKTPEKDTKEFFDALCAHFPLAREVREEVTQELAEETKTAHKSGGYALKRERERRLPVMVTRFCERLEERLISDVVHNAEVLLDKHQQDIVHAEDVRNLPELIVTPSPAMLRQLNDLKEFYKRDIYPDIVHKHLDTVHLVGLVFDDFLEGRQKMPDGWNDAYKAIRDSGKPENEIKKEQTLLVAEYLTTNMTDRDVLWHLGEYHREEAQSLLNAAKKAMYPQTPYHRDNER